MLTQKQIAALRMLASAVIDSVKAAGDFGAPGGVIYAAMNAHGATLSQYHQIMGGLVRTGRLRQEGDLFHFVRDL